ncbi:MAG: hypothetical protein PHX61_02045 [Alphaproteobacteria bacterium]|nr:hypothetical protein [Alphaproteobacteria bacterium]
MMTRVERVDARFQQNPSEHTHLQTHDEDNFERRMSKIGHAFPVAKGVDVSWGSNEMEFFSKLGRVLSLVEENAGTIDVDEITKIERASLLPALRGVCVACQAVDEIVSGKSRQVVCATRTDPEQGGKQETVAYRIFGNAAIAAHYALSKKSLKRIVLVDFNLDHGQEIRSLIVQNPDIMLMSVKVGGKIGMVRDPTAPDRIFEVGLPKLCHQNDLDKIFETLIGHEIEIFSPDLIFLSLRPEKDGRDTPDILKGEFMNDKIFSLAERYTKGRYVCILEGITDDLFIDKFKRQ